MNIFTMTHKTKNGTVTMRVACAIFFLLFTFLYLFFYQADILAVTQHVLSHGATHYDRTIGAVVLTAVLWAVQLVVYGVSGLSRQSHALTYLPSLLLLGIITGVSPHVAEEPYLGHWLWGFPLLMVAYGGLLWVCRQLEPLEQIAGGTGIFSRLAWRNLLAMVVMAGCTCLIGNSDQLFHYRMRIESLIAQGNFASAVHVGEKEAVSDSSLTMLRVWALSKEHRLGDRLFAYPLTGASDAMLPNGTSVTLLMADERRLYTHLGGMFKQKMPARRYLEALHRSGHATTAAHDWLLCACLLDRDLNAFARYLAKYYPIDDHLPKHYKEALLLYQHRSSNHAIAYRDTVKEADFEDFQKMEQKYADSRTRYTALRDKYGDTYWFYYLYSSYRG